MAFALMLALAGGAMGVSPLTVARRSSQPTEGTLSVLAGLRKRPSPRFVVEPLECPPSWFDSARLEAMLQADTSTGTGAVVALVVPDCDEAPDTLQYTIIRPRQPPLQGELTLADLPEELRLRTLALTIGEALLARPLPLPAGPMTRVRVERARTPPPPPAASAETPEPQQERRVRLGLDIGPEVFVTSSTWLAGVGLRGGGRWWDRWEWGIRGYGGMSLAGEGARNVRVRRLGLGLSALWVAFPGSFELLVGPGVDVGLAWLDIDPDDETDLALDLWPVLEVEMRFGLSAPLGLALLLRGGPILQGLEALSDGQRVAGWSEYAVGGGLRLRFDLSG